MAPPTEDMWRPRLPTDLPRAHGNRASSSIPLRKRAEDLADLDDEPLHIGVCCLRCEVAQRLKQAHVPSARTSSCVGVSLE